MLRLLTEADVRRALPMSEAIAAMRTAFTALTKGRATIPQRTNLPIGETGDFLVMPGHVEGLQTFGVKLVGLFPNNAHLGHPALHALMVVCDAQTGAPVLLLPAETLTALRTGAASGLATDFLARKDASTVAIIGAGAQGRTQLEAMCAVRAIEQAYILSRTRTHAEQFAETMQAQLGVPVAVADALQNIAPVDLICTATTSATPVLQEADVRAGTHLNAVGGYRPDRTELPLALIQRARLFVDHRAACLQESGEICQAIAEGLIQAEHMLAELGELVLGHHTGRMNPDDITIFKSVGNAAQDIVCADLIYQKAMTLGLGTTVPI